MPRSTNNDYLKSRQWLTEIWIEHQDVWANTSPAGQRVLHDYFQPSIPMQPEDALAHRRTQTARDPSLPQRAGRALKRFERVVDREIVWQPKPVVFEASGRRKARATTVRAVLKPQPDLKRLARALLSLTPDQLAKLKRGESLGDDDVA